MAELRQMLYIAEMCSHLTSYIWVLCKFYTICSLEEIFILIPENYISQWSNCHQDPLGFCSIGCLCYSLTKLPPLPLVNRTIGIKTRCKKTQTYLMSWLKLMIEVWDARKRFLDFKWSSFLNCAGMMIFFLWHVYSWEFPFFLTSRDIL